MPKIHWNDDGDNSQSFAFRKGTPAREQIKTVHKKMKLEGKRARSFQELDAHLKDTFGEGGWMEREKE